MAAAYLLEQYVEDLRRITREARNEDEIFWRLGPLAVRFAQDRSWLQDHHYRTDPDQGFGVHLLHEESDHRLAVFVVAWMPGRGAPPHDHGTWAVVAGIAGIEHNTLYKRIDDRTHQTFAELTVKQEDDIGEGDFVCMRQGGIHSVRNDTDRVTLSLHTYGRHLNHTGRSQFDVATNSRKDFIVYVD